MSADASPVHYGALEDAFITDANFKVEINQKMKVPNKISFENHNGVKSSTWSGPPPPEAINMQVPERILVVGQNQHVGTRAPPREIVYDNSILPQDPYPGDIRVATPPRSLTLDKYSFPGINDQTEEDDVGDKIPVVKPRTKFNDAMNDSIASRHNDTLGLIGAAEGLTPAEEVNHLRRQMTKLNRRVIALELENINRMQKEKIFYGLSIAYCLLKMIVWLNKSN